MKKARLGPAPTVPICRHGECTLRFGKRGDNAGEAFNCCSMPINHPDRCESAFIWVRDTAEGKRVAAEAVSNRKVPTTSAAEPAVQPKSAAVSALSRTLSSIQSQQPAVSALAMRNQLLRSSRAADARRPVDARAYECAQVLAGLRHAVRGPAERSHACAVGQ